MIEDNELIVIKKNDFVQDYKIRDLSLTDIRIINYLIANIHSPRYDKEFRKFRFNIKEFCSIIYPDQKPGSPYKRFPEAIKKLADKSVWKKVPSTEKPGKMKQVMIRWIERPEIEEDFITLELNPYLAPFFLQIDSNFFKAKFKYTALSQSKYTVPLYELLKSWEKVKDSKKIFEIDELREYMDAMKKSQDNYGEFKRTALNPAVKEINEITDISVSFTEIKRGRKVTHVEFTIIPNEEFSGDSIDDDYILDNLEDIVVEEPEIKDEFTSDEEYYIYWDTLNKEFSRREIEELVDIAKEIFDISLSDGSDDDKNKIKICDYLLYYYKALEFTEIKYSRFAALRDKVRNDYDCRAF